MENPEVNVLLTAALSLSSAGISTIETESPISIVLPDKITDGEWMVPKINRACRAGDAPILLWKLRPVSRETLYAVPDLNVAAEIGTGIPLRHNDPNGPIGAREVKIARLMPRLQFPGQLRRFQWVLGFFG